MAVKGIDVSFWQGWIDWESVKASGIGFAILKAGGSDDGVYTDSKFERNYAECKRLGIPVGAYWFVGKGCISTADGEADAKQFLKRLQGKQFELPVYMDCETTPFSERKGATNAAFAFCRYLEEKNWYVGIYGSTYSTFESRLDDYRLTRFAHWVAQYASRCEYTGTYGIWQYSSSGYVSGIIGNVDMNYLYIDYPTIIKKAGRNGFKPQSSAADKKPAAAAKKETVKKCSVNGKWDVATTKRAQWKLGTPVDGEVWNQLNICKPYLEACLPTSWKFSDERKGGSLLIKALQKLVGADDDGYAGEETVMKLQEFLNREINAGLDVDGKCGSDTVTAFQKWLNK